MSVASGALNIGAILENLVQRIEGSTAVAVVGIDGVVIDQRSCDPRLNLDLISVGHTSLIKQAAAFLRDSNAGEAKELILAASRLKFVARLLARDYFLLIILHPQASLGRARHAARRAGPLLEAELR
jgi:predicted regulator of Ras-like GTPase activity (Roadblock/LC7/MglB family)